MKKYYLRLSLGLLLALGAGGSAFAHAFLDHASPAVGSTLAAAPPSVRIWFTQALEPAFSGAEVSDAKGNRVESGAPRIAGNLMTIALKPLPPGEYQVHWHVISVDTHATEGNFTFRVGS
jgi:methionine-rich copper-binding protein CopC